MNNKSNKPDKKKDFIDKMELKPKEEEFFRDLEEKVYKFKIKFGLICLGIVLFVIFLMLNGYW